MPTYIQNNQTKIQSTRGAMPVPAGSPHIGFVLDKSSSMESLSNNAIAGFNSLIEEQRKIAPDSKFSLSLFSDLDQLVYNALPVSEVPLLTAATYKTGGGTALNDGIGQMIQRIGKQTNRRNRVLIAILTDGAENFSREFGVEDIQRMITYRRLNYDWQFVFVTADEAGVQYGLKLGIQRANIVKFNADPSGITAIMIKLSAGMKAYQFGDKHYHLLLK